MATARKSGISTETMENALRREVPATELIGKLPKSTLQGHLTALIGRKRISTDAVAELAGLNRASLYRILNGSTRHPQRNVLLRLALVLGLSFRETQELLRCGGRAALSGSRARDIILSDGIIRGLGISEVNARLRAHCFVDLYSKE